MAAKIPTKPKPVSPDRGDMIATGLLMMGALAAILGFGFLFSLWWQNGVQDDYEVLRIASQEFVNGRPIVAGDLAETVVFDEPTAAAGEEAAKRIRWSSLRDFLVGVGLVARANRDEDLRARRRILYEAIVALETAESQGFPLGRMAQGYRVLGESLYHVGRYDEAIDALMIAIEEDPSQRRDLLPMLAESQLNALAPLTDQSLATIETYLADRALSPRQRWTGELIHLRAMIELGMWDRVQETIQRESRMRTGLDLQQQAEQTAYHDELRLMQSVADVRRAIGRYGRYGELDDKESRDRAARIAELNEAIERMSILQREASSRLASQAKLWSARAYLIQGRKDEALKQLSAVSRQRPLGAEAIVGGLEEIELFARHSMADDLLDTTRYLMRELGDDRGFDASLISLDEFQRRMIGAIERLRQQGHYEAAIDAARSLPPVFDRIEALTQEGIGFREWAAATIARGTDISGQVARNASIQARARYRAAGDAFAKAAELQFNSDEYVSTQWSAIDAYQQGRHFSQSIRLLESYLRYETRGRLPRGLVAYGRALLAEDEPDTAIEALMTCIIDYPRDPLRYDARLLAALAYAEKGDLEDAKRLLQDNLHDGELTPQSPAWRDSLLTLGELLYEHGYRNHLVAQQSPASEKLRLLRDNQPILDEAIRRLDEAVERYWPIPRAEAAAYLSSRAHVMSSEWPRIESQVPEILDAARRVLRNQADQQLQAALEGFDRLQRHLSKREEEQRLPDNQQSILRNCLLAEADVLREMDRPDEAASAYRAVELRFMNEPPALEAILGRAACAKQLGRPREADMLIRQASVVLQRIPNEMNDRFTETTRYDRIGWEQLLGWMNQRINAGGV